MIFPYKKVERAIVVLNDLIQINNDRISCYQQALHQGVNLDMDMKLLFKEIITEAQKFKQELIDQVKLFEGNPKNRITLSGRVHRAWMDLKVTFTGNTRHAIISFCEYHEVVAQQTYKAALNIAAGMNKNVFKLIEEQQTALMKTYDAINKCHEARNYLYPDLLYYS
jgi:uncharacterized protein (TIGR02284 family)